MIWYKHLYVGDMVRGRKDRIMSRIESDRSDGGHYLITLSENDHEQLDLISTFFLTERKRSSLPMIVGLAATKREAVGLVKKMTEDCYRETHDVDLRRFFMSRKEEKP